MNQYLLKLLWYKWFENSFENILENHRGKIERDFWIKVKNLGVYSFRKKATGYISSEYVMCVPLQVATNFQAI